MIENLQKNWWLVALRGIFAILFGIAIFLKPAVIFSLLTLFGFFVILSGLVIIIHAFTGKSPGKWLILIEGLVFIITGLLVISNPAFIVGWVMILIAVWAVVSGVFNIINAVNLRKVITNEWLMILNGAVSILFGIVVAANLLESAITITKLFGIFALISGVFLLILSFRIKNAKLTE
jgi:uncharacterized membrane protein HdeD (DUF308 family)